MISNYQGLIQFNGRTFYGFEQLGFTDLGQFILYLYSYPPPHEPLANYANSLAISSDSYRNSRTTKVAVREDNGSFIISDDYGTEHKLTINHPPIIEQLIKEAISHNIKVKTMTNSIPGYRTLSQEELDLVRESKELEQSCMSFIRKLRKHSDSSRDQVGDSEVGPALDQQWISIGTIDLSKGFMAIIRGITKPTEL